MQDYDERVAQSFAAASSEEDNADDDDAEQHTQFLDLTNGEGGSHTSIFYESDEEEGEDGTTALTTIDPSTPGRVVETGQEHTGRWTREEHSAFLTALKMYGKEWKKVAAKVKTRTVVQTRTHAQKYFQKLQKAGTGDDPGRVASVEMGVDAKKASAQKKRKAAAPKPPQRMQSTASTHAAAHVMTNLSSAQMSAPFISSAYAQPTAYSSSSASTSAPLFATHGFSTATTHSASTSVPSFATHGFSTATTSNNQNDQPLLPPQALPSYPRSGGFFGGFGLSIVAPQDSARSKFPEPSPAACGKRKLAEIAAAQMLAGVASQAGEAATPPPPELPFEPWMPSLGLQIVNPETLGVTYNETRRRGDPSPTTPWDGQLQALVSEKRMKDDIKLYQEEDFDLDVKISAEGANGHSDFMHSVCGPAVAFGRSLLHQAVCDMNAVEVNRVITREDLHRRDEAGYCPLHTACALTMLGSYNMSIASNICQILLSAGADVVQVDSNGNTALHWAARAGNESVAHMLLQNNCPPSVQNGEGETALHWAMRAGRVSLLVVCLLLDNGGLASVVNKQFKRPLDVAVEAFVGDEEKKAQDQKVKKSNKAGKKKIEFEIVQERREVRANLLAHSTQSRTLVLHHPECLEHVPKSESDWEVPDRVNAIMRRIMPEMGTTETTGIFAQEVAVSSEFDRAKLDLLSRVHSAEYLSFVNELSKDLERQRKEGMEMEEEPSGRMPAGVPFTPMVQRTVMKDFDLKNIKQADHSDTSFSAGSLRAARRAAGAVQHAVDCVLIGRNRNAFCVVRPPGHHAGIQGLLAGGESCGFCIFNNVAAGALHAISEEQSLCKRCAIVDIDVHHGNGTEEIVRKCHDPARLLFFSIHLFDHDKKRNKATPAYGYKFYPGTGEEDDLAHNIINVPIAPLWKEQNDGAPKDASAAPQSTHNTRQKVKQKTASATNSPREWGTGDESSATEITKASDTESETASKVSKKSATPASSPRYVTTGRHAYRRAIQDRLLPALRAFNPDLILISAGFDAAKGDVGNARHFVGGDQRMGLDLEPEDYAWTTRKILEIADICCHGRVVSVLEGGYGRTPVSTANTNEPHPLDKSLFAECAIRHLQAMIDPYDVEARFTSR